MLRIPRVSPSTSVTLTEDQIRKQVTCAMSNQQDDNRLESAAWDTLRWATLRRFFNEPLNAEQTREEFRLSWNKVWGKHSPQTAEYWRGIRKCAGLSRRIYMLLRDCAVLQPFEPYELVLEAGNISGVAAILAPRDTRRIKGRAIVLSPLVRQARDKRTPDYVALARWLAMSDRTEHADLTLLHFPLLFGESYRNVEVNTVLAEQWLNGILKRAALAHIPVPGPWCRACSHPCRAVTKIPISPLVAADALLK